jgi:hypothetical protein
VGTLTFGSVRSVLQRTFKLTRSVARINTEGAQNYSFLLSIIGNLGGKVYIFSSILGYFVNKELIEQFEQFDDNVSGEDDNPHCICPGITIRIVTHASGQKFTSQINVYTQNTVSAWLNSVVVKTVSFSRTMMHTKLIRRKWGVFWDILQIAGHNSQWEG